MGVEISSIDMGEHSVAMTLSTLLIIVSFITVATLTAFIVSSEQGNLTPKKFVTFVGFLVSCVVGAFSLAVFVNIHLDDHKEQKESTLDANKSLIEQSYDVRFVDIEYRPTPTEEGVEYIDAKFTDGEADGISYYEGSVRVEGNTATLMIPTGNQKFVEYEG